MTKVYQTTAIICGAQLALCALVVLVVEFVKNQTLFAAYSRPATVQIILYGVYAITFAQIGVLQILRMRLLQHKDGQSREQKLGSLRTCAIITSALCETIALYALALFLLVRLYHEFYLLVALAVVLQIFYFPRQRVWRAWLGEDDHSS